MPTTPAHSGRAMLSGSMRAPPAANAPQLEHIRYWRAEASSGDPYARCRYAREAQHCAALIMNTADWMRERFVAKMVTRGDFGEIPDCRGVTPQDILPQFDQLLQSASGGHTPSQLLFAAGGGFALAEGVRFPERLHQFRDHAATLAWRAFDRGDPDAVVLLWRAYQGVDRDVLFLAGAIDPNPVTARALDLLMHELNSDHVVADAADSGLDKAGLRQAQDLLRDWREHAFAHPRTPRYGLRIETMFDWEKRAVDLCADVTAP